MPACSNITHRDLKLENLLLQRPVHENEPPAVKIADFGLAKKMAEQSMQTICGTPQYVAPEVILVRGFLPYYPKCCAAPEVTSVGRDLPADAVLLLQRPTSATITTDRCPANSASACCTYGDHDVLSPAATRAPCSLGTQPASPTPHVSSPQFLLHSRPERVPFVAHAPQRCHAIPGPAVPCNTRGGVMLYPAHNHREMSPFTGAARRARRA